MSGGSEGMFGSVAGLKSGQGKDSSMPAYGADTPVRTTGDANRYTPTYAPMQQTPQQSIQNMGLQALYQSMANQFAPISQQQNPMDQFYKQQQMPEYKNPALNYRPDMSGITANLKRVVPSVQEQQRLQAIEDARIRAEQEAWDAAHPQPTYD